VSGLDLPAAALEQLFELDLADWQREVTLLHDHYAQFGKRLPGALRTELQALESAVKTASR